MAATLCALAWSVSAGAQVRPMPLPAAEGSGMYALAAAPDGRVYASWIEPLGQAADGHALKFATLAGGRWSAAREIARGKDWFVNWADHPSIAVLPNGALAAHWLVKNGTGQGHYGYGLRIAHSTDGGATWRTVFEAGKDNGTDYSGFVSILPEDSGFTAAYLTPLKPDAPASAAAASASAPGAAMAMPGHGGEHIKTLAVARFGADGALLSDVVLDRDTCSCCVTAIARTADGPIVAYRDHDEEIRDIYTVRASGGAWSTPRPVHRDGWKINGCPTNGPALAAEGRRAAIAWFTAAGDEPRVKVAFSADAGARFDAPVVVDEGKPVGWPGIVLLEEGAAVSWLETRADGGGDVRVRRVGADGQLGAPIVVAQSKAGRTTGVPQLVRAGKDLVIAWRTDRVTTAIVPITMLPAPRASSSSQARAQSPSRAPEPAQPESAPPSEADARPHSHSQSQSQTQPQSQPQPKADPQQPEAVTPPSVKESVTVVGALPSDRLSLDEPTSVGSRLGLTPRETPASVAVVSRDVIERRGATDTQEILNSVPGMTAAAPPGSAGSVSYRGFGGSQLTQLFNGISVQYDAVAARPVDSWIYDRVEVIGGPSTFLFGAGAVGGSINYVTRLATPHQDSAQARVSYGSYGATELAAGVNRRLGDPGARVRHAVRADVARTGADGYVDGNQRRAWSSAASWRADIGGRLSHTVALEYQDEKVDRPYWGTPLLNPATGDGRIDERTRFANYNARDGAYDQTVVWARSLLEYRLSPRTTLRNTLYHYDALRDFRNVEVYRYNAANTGIVRSAALLTRHDQRMTGNRAELQHATRLGRWASDWAAGVDISGNRQTRFPRSLPATVDTVDPFDFTTGSFFDVPGMTPDLTPDRTNTVDTVALFVENRTRLTRALSVVSGLRHDRIDLDVTNHRTVTPTDPAAFSRVYRPTTGRVGVTYAVARAVNVYAQYSTAADPPAGILTTANFAQLRDFDLTTGRQSEVGSKLDFLGGRGTATTAVFTIVRKNLAIPDPDDPTITQPVGQQSSRGVELAVSLRAARPLLLQGNYAFVSATFDDFTENVGGVAVSREGNHPANMPAHVGNMWVTYSVTPAWEAGVDARFVSSRYGNAANTIGAPAYGLYGAFVSYRVRPGALVTFRARNLTDEIYARSITSTPMFFLGAPRTFELALRVGL